MELNDQLKQLEKEVLDPLVDEMMKNEIPPSNLLVSQEDWKEKKKKELIDFYSGKKDFNRVDAALEALRSEFAASLSSVEQDKLLEEWETGVKKINGLLEQPAEEPIPILPQPLRGMMNLSELFMESFYSIGVKYFHNQDFTKAADIFFLLSLIDFQRHAIWVSLGLSEMKLGQFEPALNAFAMASITNAAPPYPYIYSAECCIALNCSQEATTYLALAKEALGSSSPEEREKLLGKINTLEQKSRF
jgi:tetratricopeptide (TPR) repeat protein